MAYTEMQQRIDQLLEEQRTLQEAQGQHVSVQQYQCNGMFVTRCRTCNGSKLWTRQEEKPLCRFAWGQTARHAVMARPL